MNDNAHPHTGFKTNRPQPVAVVTDSVGQVPAGVVRQLGITVVPMTVIINGRPFLDGVDLDLAELYRRMRLEKVVPSTTAPAPGEFQQAFLRCLAGGAGSVLCITLSSRLSTTFGCALDAARLVKAEHPRAAIEVLDSRQGAIAEGFITMAAARAAADGGCLPDVLQAAREAGKRSGLAVTLETLEYLARGGRIGRAAYLLGSLVNVRPVLIINKEGLAGPIASLRSEARAMERIVEYVAAQTAGCRRLTLAVMDTDSPRKADRLLAMALEKVHPAEVLRTEFTPVMGVHTGPGLIGLGYYYE